MIYFRHDDAGAIVFEVLFNEVGLKFVSACATLDAEWGLNEGMYSSISLEALIENCGGLDEMIEGSEIVSDGTGDLADFLIESILYRASKN